MLPSVRIRSVKFCCVSAMYSGFGCTPCGSGWKMNFVPSGSGSSRFTSGAVAVRLKNRFAVELLTPRARVVAAHRELDVVARTVVEVDAEIRAIVRAVIAKHAVLLLLRHAS